jgi:hypothetical protein
MVMYLYGSMNDKIIIIIIIIYPTALILSCSI